MNTEKQRVSILEKIQNDAELSTALKEKFLKQISSMNDAEFAAFAKSVQESNGADDVNEKIAQIERMERINHTDFLQVANEFSNKALRHETKKQEASDELKVDAILNKIKSL